MISILIPTKNEEKNIEECIISAKKISNDIKIVDSYSSDKTKEIALRFNDVEVVDFNYNGNWPKKKNWAIENLNWNNDWIFILDADERISNEMKKEIECLFSNGLDDSINSIMVKWEFYFLGKKLKHSWRGAYMTRIFRIGKAMYENLGMTNEGGWDNEVHEHLVYTNY